LELAPDRVDALGNLANSLIKRGDIDRAGELLDRAVRADPYDDLARLSLGVHQLTRQRKAAQGAENLKLCVELNPTSVTGYRMLAMMHSQQGGSTGL